MTAMAPAITTIATAVGTAKTVKDLVDKPKLKIEPPPQPQPQKIEAEVEKEARKRLQALKRRKRGTILTGALGVATKPVVGRKTLLGE